MDPDDSQAPTSSDAIAEGFGEPVPVPSAPARTTLAIALADHTTVTEIAAVVAASSDLEIVATAADPAGALAIAQQHVPDVLIIGADLVMTDEDLPPEPVPEPLPDEVDESEGETAASAQPGAAASRGPVTDLAHPVAVGLRALCGAVNDELPVVRIVIVAPEGVNSYGAVLGGAIACLPPSDLVDRVVAVTRAAAWGEGLLTQEWARAVLADLGNRTGDRTEAGPLGRPVLTPTELEVLRRTAGGETATDIAARHAVSERDVNRCAAYALLKAQRLHDDWAIAGSG